MRPERAYAPASPRQRREEGCAMEFGYFTLSDNHYETTSRTSNQFIADITDEALYADKIGMHSAWIGDHLLTRSAFCPAPTLCCPTSHHARGTSGSHRP